ncbi:MAG: peroxiredoxin-like family protein [Catalinimonas sp.]
MRLDINAPAPPFSVDDVDGRPITLEAYRGRKVLLAFFRHVGCPFCNMRVYTLAKAHAAFQARGLDMVFFFESKAKLIKMSSFHQGASPIPLVSDPEKHWYGVYGLEESKKKPPLKTFFVSSVQAKLKGAPLHFPTGGESNETMPAEFLIDEAGIVRQLHYSDRITDRLNLDDIHAFADHPAAAPVLV